MSPGSRFLMLLIAAGIAGIITVFCGVALKPAYDQWQASIKLPNVSFQKLATFFIKKSETIYTIGIVAKLFNLDDKPYLINGIGVSYDPESVLSFVPRGGYLIQRILITQSSERVIEDNYLKPFSEGYYKIVLPINFTMKVMGGSAPELIFFGKWSIIVRDKNIEITPEMYASYTQFVTESDWNNLLRSNSSIDVTNLPYKKIPLGPIKPGMASNYLLYSEDKSLQFSAFGWDTTQYVTSDKGVMVFIRGVGVPEIPYGWAVLGRTYSEVWRDPAKLQIYNSIYPPDASGRPKPFGVFAGADSEMIGQ